MSESISEKAKALKSKVETEIKTAEEEAARIRKEDLQNKLDSEKVVKETQNKKNNAVSQKRSEIEEILQTNKQERYKLQSEGKETARELRTDEAGKKVLESEVYRTEIFGETISKLKEINESTKSYRTELKQLLAEAKEEGSIYSSQKQKRLDEFRAAHPELSKLQEIASEYEKQLKYFNTNENKVKEFLGDPEIAVHLNDEIGFDRYRSVVDTTLKLQYEALEKKLEEVRKSFHMEEDDIDAMKKGFFESQNSFLAKKRALREDLKKRQQAAEDEIFRGPGNFNEIGKMTKKIEEGLLSFIIGFGYSNNDKENIIAEVKNIKGLVLWHEKYLQEQKKKYTLTEEEQLLLDLNRELWTA